MFKVLVSEESHSCHCLILFPRTRSCEIIYQSNILGNVFLWKVPAYALLYQRHFDFPQCGFQYPTINICAHSPVVQQVFESKVVWGTFASGIEKRDFTSLKLNSRFENHAPWRLKIYTFSTWCFKQSHTNTHFIIIYISSSTSSLSLSSSSSPADWVHPGGFDATGQKERNWLATSAVSEFSKTRYNFNSDTFLTLVLKTGRDS